jgi:hypothetical protein
MVTFVKYIIALPGRWRLRSMYLIHKLRRRYRNWLWQRSFRAASKILVPMDAPTLAAALERSKPGDVIVLTANGPTI